MICELFLPKMIVLEAIKAIRQIHPRMPIITASGFMFGGACPQMPNFDAMAAEVGATSTLYKPFRPKDLLQAIQIAKRRHSEADALRISISLRSRHFCRSAMLREPASAATPSMIVC